MGGTLKTILLGVIGTLTFVILQVIEVFFLNAVLFEFSGVKFYLTVLIFAIFATVPTIWVVNLIVKKLQRETGNVEHEDSQFQILISKIRKTPTLKFLVVATSSVLAVATYFAIAVLVVTQLIPFLESYPQDKVRVVMANFKGPDYKDRVGDEGLVKSIVSSVNKRINENGVSKYIDIDFTYLPVHDSTQALEVGLKYGAALVIWGTWEGNEGEMRIDLHFKSFGNFWFIRGEVREYYDVDIPIERFIHSSQFIRNKEELADLSYMLTRFLSLFSVGRINLPTEKVAFAERTLTELQHRIHPSVDYMLFTTLGNELAMAGRNHEAIAPFLAAHSYLTSYEPTNKVELADCEGQLAFLHMKVDMLKEARTFLSLALKNSPSMYKLLRVDAMLAYHEHATDSLISLANLVRQVYPDSIEINELIGNNLLKLGKPVLGFSVLLLADSLKRDTESASHLYRIGSLAGFSGDTEKAEKYLRQSLVKEPCNTPARARLAILLYCQNRYRESLELIGCDKISTSFEQSDLPLYRYLCFLGLGEFDSADVYIPLYIDSTRALLERAWMPDRPRLERQSELYGGALGSLSTLQGELPKHEGI